MSGLTKYKYFLIFISFIIIILGILVTFLFARPQVNDNLNWQANYLKSSLSNKLSNVYNKVSPEGSQVVVVVKEDYKSEAASTIKHNRSDVFVLSISPEYFIEGSNYKKDFLKKVLAHELMHIWSLQNSQFDYLNSSEFVPTSREVFDAEEYKCKPKYFNTEGCFSENSYINSFYSQFWIGDLKKEYDEIQNIGDADKFSSSIQSWGKKYEDQFVSKNAYIGPEEDLAESFSIWILDYNTDKLTEVQKQKIKFFEQFPELQKLKTYFSTTFDKEFIENSDK